MKDVTLRQAEPDDLEFLWKLHIASMKDYVEATWGWDESWQRETYVRDYEPESAQIIQFGNEDVGLLAVGSLGAFTFLKQTSLLPEFQCKGIGTHVINDVLARAHGNGCPVLLQVLKVNPAKRLYERLGFTVCGETETHYPMISEP